MKRDRRSYDPLSFIPSPEPIRKHLNDTLGLVERLRVLLEVSERVHGQRDASPASYLQREGVAVA